jgi:spermidine synthase
VLENDNVSTLLVVDYLAPVIEWHKSGILPMGTKVAADSRTRLVEGDFFALAAGNGFDPDQPQRQFDAILADIDHAPDNLLDDRSDSFYQPAGLQVLNKHLKPGGIFGLWSNEAPDQRFLDRLTGAFATAWAEKVEFANEATGQTFIQTVYLARTKSD